MLAILCLLAIFPKGVMSECNMNAETCEFWLEISGRLTMMRGNEAVYPYNGKLFKYDVLEADTNVTEPVDPNEVVVADGWEAHRLVTVINGTMPGPSIEVYENQTVIVHVKNTLTSSGTSIHWHGLHQRDTPWMDGVAFVTQCPIDPGQTFTYRFKASPKGTFFYHSHIGSLLASGVVGAFIIRERKEPQMPEHILTVQDWNHDWESENIHYRSVYGSYINRQRVRNKASLEGGRFSRFQFQSGLINGRGRFFDDTNTSNMSPLTVIEVKQNETYRFRVIGGGIVYSFRVSVDGHSLTLVASDGFEITPVEMESFVIHTGERYDFIMKADQPVGNYWIRAESLEVDAENHIALAILRYKNAPEEEPTSERKRCEPNNRCKVGNCHFSHYPEVSNTDCINVEQFTAAEKYQTPGNDENMDEEIEDIFLNFGFPGKTVSPPSVNGRSLLKPPAPPLTQPDKFATRCTEKDDCGEDKVCFCALSVDLEHNKVYQVVFVNMGNGKGFLHPIHMHGHSYYVVKIGYPIYNTTTGVIMRDNADLDCGENSDDSRLPNCNHPSWSNSSWGGNSVPGLKLESPPRKDTIAVPTGGYVVVRIKADNPGVWFMHCHVDIHVGSGMALMLNESFSRQPMPPAGFPKCGNFDYTSEEGDDDPEDSPKYSECDDDCDEKEIYWAVIGSLGGVILFQLLYIVYLLRRDASASPKSSSPSQSPPTAESHTNQGFSE